MVGKNATNEPLASWWLIFHRHLFYLQWTETKSYKLASCKELKCSQICAKFGVSVVSAKVTFYRLLACLICNWTTVEILFKVSACSFTIILLKQSWSKTEFSWRSIRNCFHVFPAFGQRRLVVLKSESVFNFRETKGYILRCYMLLYGYMLLSWGLLKISFDLQESREASFITHATWGVGGGGGSKGFFFLKMFWRKKDGWLQFFLHDLAFGTFIFYKTVSLIFLRVLLLIFTSFYTATFTISVKEHLSCKMSFTAICW